MHKMIRCIARSETNLQRYAGAPLLGVVPSPNTTTQSWVALDSHLRGGRDGRDPVLVSHQLAAELKLLSHGCRGIGTEGKLGFA